MLFPTLIFAVFFFIVFTLHWILVSRPRIWKPFMLSASYVFYGWWDWRFLALIAACTITSHLAAVAMARNERPALRRLFLILALAFNLGMLGFFKYYGFFATSLYQLCRSLNIPCSLPLLDIVLPVGISFFTFQALSYVVDVYRRAMDPARNIIDFAIYLSFFPQLVAGPIVRARDLLPQVAHPERCSPMDIGRAAGLILMGLFKKMVIANTLATAIVDPVFAHPTAYGAPDILLAIYGYAVQIYCDFSAYSDMAIGFCLLLGFDIMLNFNAPYFAQSLQEFWQRWHISLSTFIRDYLYFPMGGSKLSERKTYRNLIISFLLAGLWHGANWKFVFWGLLHGVYRAAERFVETRILRHPLSPATRASGAWGRFGLPFLKRLWLFHFVCLTWFFFRAESFHYAWTMLGQLAHWTKPLAPPVIIAIIAVGFLTQFGDGQRMRKIWDGFARLNPVWQGLLAAVILTVILALGPEGVAPFIYFQF
ncbi:MAG: MBOAT family protein [Verrucomicrobia bacterium]|nr:MBOAT family protein [Verrucomicrobiota bacterium]MBU1734742.1 MBOAT family protein [Verrucomicrobiota bacterium]MBU1857760.1 MBOAT family protein [Verrucomicrobiota bacterium]